MKNDIDLAIALEDAIGQSHVAYAQMHKQLTPQSQALSIEIMGGYAAFASQNDVLTQAIAIGLHGPVTTHEFDQLEQFYFSRQTPVAIELCPMADQSVLHQMNQRQYQVTEFSNILYLPLKPTMDLPSLPNGVDFVETQDDSLWADITTQGFMEDNPVPPTFLHCFKIFANIPQVKCFLALIDGQPVGGAAIGIYGEICDLGFGSTLPKWRGRGVQKGLLNALLQYAIRQRCRIATGTTEPGSISQQNVEKFGFKVAYTRIKFEKKINAL